MYNLLKNTSRFLISSEALSYFVFQDLIKTLLNDVSYFNQAQLEKLHFFLLLSIHPSTYLLMYLFPSYYTHKNSVEHFHSEFASIKFIIVISYALQRVSK